MTFFWVGHFEFFCFIFMKTSQSLLVSKDGSKFWWLLWFPVKNHSPQIFQPAVYQLKMYTTQGWQSWNLEWRIVMRMGIGILDCFCWINQIINYKVHNHKMYVSEISPRKYYILQYVFSIDYTGKNKTEFSFDCMKCLSTYMNSY